MKKLLLIASALLAFSFFGCNQPSTPAAGSSDVTQPGTGVKEDLVIFDTEQTFTTNGYGTKYDLGESVDLTGYKYIKVEASTTDTDANKIAIQFVNSDYKLCGLIESTSMTSDTTAYYSDCGTNFWQDTDYDGTPDTQSEVTTLNLIQIYAQSTSTWSTVDGVEVTISKVTLTNNKE